MTARKQFHIARVQARLVSFERYQRSTHTLLPLYDWVTDGVFAGFQLAASSKCCWNEQHQILTRILLIYRLQLMIGTKSALYPDTCATAPYPSRRRACTPALTKPLSRKEPEGLQKQLAISDPTHSSTKLLLDHCSWLLGPAHPSSNAPTSCVAAHEISCEDEALLSFTQSLLRRRF
jgi:hypothetical protein